MRALLCLLLLTSTTASAQEQPPQPPPGASEPTVEKPPWRPARGIPDLTMIVAQRAPLELQPSVLIALDFALPLVVAVPGALIGGAVGAVLGSLRYPTLPNTLPQVDPGLPLLLGISAGSLVGGGLTLLGADVALNTFHLGKLAPSRITGALVLIPGVLLVALSVAALSAQLPVDNPVLEGALRAFAGGAFVLGFCCLPPLAVVTALTFRVISDYVDGSALWERDALE